MKLRTQIEDLNLNLIKTVANKHIRISVLFLFFFLFFFWGGGGDLFSKYQSIQLIAQECKWGPQLKI